jgi:hypothetical protein
MATATWYKPLTSAISRVDWLTGQPVVLACLVPIGWLFSFALLPVLPDILATSLALSMAFVVPGLALLFLAPGRWALCEALALSLLLGFGLASVLAIPALLVHMPLVTAAVPLVLATVVLVFAAASRPRATVEVSAMSAGFLAFLFGVMVVISVAAGDDRLRRSVDDWHDLAYTASYLAGDDINAEDPNIGAGVDITARRVFNVISIHQAITAQLGDIDAVDLGLKHYQLLASFLAAVATYALASRLAGNERTGLFAVALLAAIALTDTLTTEGYGRGVLLRAADDKFFTSLVLLPAFMLLVLTFRGGWPQTALLALGAMSVALMHPFGAAFVGIAIAALVIASFWRWRNNKESRSEFVSKFVTAGVILGLAGIPALYQRFFVDDEFSDRFGGENQVGLAHRRFDLPFDLVALDWSMITHPLLWLAILVAPLVIWRLADARRGALIGMFVIALPLALLFPISATILGKLGSPGLLWRFVVIIPFAPVLALLVTRMRVSVYAQAAGVLTLAFLAFPLKEVIAQVNSSYYGENFGDSALQAGLRDAWERDRERLDTRSLRIEGIEQIVRDIDDLIDGEALVLLPPRVGSEGIYPPRNVDIALPAVETELKSYTSGGYGQVVSLEWDEGEVAGPILGPGHIGFRKRSLFAEAFYSGQLPPMVRLEALFAEKRITHVLVPGFGNVSQRLATSDAFVEVGTVGNHTLFRYVG